LVPPDSFYRRFRNLMSPLVRCEDIDSMYCKDTGRPPIPPSLLAMAAVLQEYKAFSEREMGNACNSDIQIKFGLGLQVDEIPGANLG
jgi:transposase